MFIYSDFIFKTVSNLLIADKFQSFLNTYDEIMRQ